MNRSTALIILAAGESKRLGQPKQQVVFQGESLLQRTINAGIQANCNPVLTILGTYQPEIAMEADREKIEFLVNEQWKQGMASTIQFGVQKLMKDQPPDQLILMLCDQPYADKHLLRKMIELQHSSGKPIVACAYKNTLGAPVLLDRKFFPHLLRLKGREGAKKLLFEYPHEVAVIPFPLGHIDIDTPADLEALHKVDSNDQKE